MEGNAIQENERMPCRVPGIACLKGGAAGSGNNDYSHACVAWNQDCPGVLKYIRVLLC